MEALFFVQIPYVFVLFSFRRDIHDMIYLTGICIFIQLCWMDGMKSPTG